MALNIFQNPKPNKLDIEFFGLLTILLLIFLIGYLQSTSIQNFGTIYFYLTVIIFIFLLVAIATHFKVFTWVIFGNEIKANKFWTDITIGIVLALILNSGILGFSIAIPLAVTGTATNSILITLIILAFYGPLVEELFWIGTFVPSYSKYLNNNLWYIFGSPSTFISSNIKGSY